MGVVTCSGNHCYSLKRRQISDTEQTKVVPRLKAMASNSAVVTEMSEIMENAIANERRKNKKLREKLNKAEKQLQKQSVDGGDEAGEENEDPNDPNSGWLQQGEVAIILDHMENRLNLLVGKGKSSQYKKDREKAWSKLLDEINRWNEAQKTGKIRRYSKIKKKIDNIKKNGVFLYL